MKTTIKVNGMTCGGCVNSVTNAIKRVDGVTNVVVSLEKKRATVDFEDSKTSVERIEAAIADAGYQPAGAVIE